MFQNNAVVRFLQNAPLVWNVEGVPLVQKGASGEKHECHNGEGEKSFHKKSDKELMKYIQDLSGKFSLT